MTARGDAADRGQRRVERPLRLARDFARARRRRERVVRLLVWDGDLDQDRLAAVELVLHEPLHRSSSARSEAPRVFVRGEPTDATSIGECGGECSAARGVLVRGRGRWRGAQSRGT